MEGKALRWREVVKPSLRCRREVVKPPLRSGGGKAFSALAGEGEEKTNRATSAILAAWQIKTGPRGALGLQLLASKVPEL